MNHQIHCSHVDAQLKTAGGHDGAQLPALELVFNHDSLFACQRTVVRFDKVGITQPKVNCQLVELCRKPFGATSGVAKNNGAAMLLHQFENLRGDARPDAGAALDTCGRGWATAQFGGYFAE